MSSLGGVSNAAASTLEPPPAELSSADCIMRRLLLISDTPRPVRERDVQRMFSTGILLSALRCLLSYVVLPLLGPILGVTGGVGPAIGLPLAGWMMEKNMGASLPGRTAALLFWLFLVISPALFLGVREAPAPKAGVKVVSLPGGSEVLLKMEMNGDLLAARPADGLSFTLLQPLEVAMKDGVPEGRFRFGAGKWQSIRDGVLDLRISALSPRLENGMPVVHAVASLKVSGR